jgi:hypothetical protein
LRRWTSVSIEVRSGLPIHEACSAGQIVAADRRAFLPCARTRVS